MGIYSTSGIWQSWTPTLANLTIGNGTTTAQYTQFGQTVIANIYILFGSTTSMGTGPTFTLPVNASTFYTGGSITHAPLGSVSLVHEGVVIQTGIIETAASATTASFKAFAASGTATSQVAVTSTVPFTWASTDKLVGTIVYQSA